jgi:hypothetical protein
MIDEPQFDPELEDLASRLEAERPVPRAAFRGELRRNLLANYRTHAAPRRLRLMISAYAGSGAALLVVATVGLAGVGPFGA